MMEEQNNDLAIELPTLKSESPVVAPVNQNTNLETNTPILSEKVEEPIAMPSAPVTPIMPTAPVINPEPVAPIAPVIPETPVMQPITEAPVVNEPVAAPVQNVQTAVQNTPAEAIAMPNTPVVSMQQANAPVEQSAEVAKEPEIKKASKTAQLIGTIVLLLITGLIGFWIVKNYFML